tara:strand:+ start:1650 stop:3932 length:2283 start_codon:yes stop_codon:yes gene_type:complete
MSLGKRKYIIDEVCFSGSVTDFLRLTFGAYHKTNAEGNFAFGYNVNKKTGYGLSNQGEALFAISPSGWSIAKDTVNSTATEIKETITISADYWESNIVAAVPYPGPTDPSIGIQSIADWYNGTTDEPEYSDHYCNYYTPFDSDEKITLNENTFTSDGNVEFVYNYFDKIREEKLNNLSVQQLRNTKTSFDQYGDINVINPSSTSENIILSPNVLEDLGDISSIKNYLSMYSNISFDTDSISTFTEGVEETRYTTSLMISMLQYAFQNDESVVFYQSDSIIAQDGSVTSEISNGALPTFDFQDFVDNLNINGIYVPVPVKVYDVGSNELGYTSQGFMDVGAYFMKLIISGKLSNLVQNKLRSYSQVLKGEPAYDETIVYEINKYENGTFIERYFVPNSQDTSINNIIDSHMRYNKEYQYTFFAHKIVIGSVHKFQKYSDVTETLASGFGEGFANLPIPESYSFDITTTPSVKLIRVPYFKFSGHIIDSPSISPDVNIVPYMGVDDQLLLMLTQPIGEYEKPAVFLDQSELVDISKYQQMSNRLITDDVLYKTDDTPYSFLIYRLDKKPNKITNFAGNVHKQITTLLSGQNYTYAASFVDSLTPNTKYYYLFRSVDAHGKLSDISNVYQAELVNDHGSIYLLMSLFEFETEDTQSVPDRSFRRLLQIKPNLVQTFFKDEISDYSSVTEIPESIEILGHAEDAAWNKKFKIRLTSKKTGRIVDLNLTFKQQLTQTQLDIPTDDIEDQDDCGFSTPVFSAPIPG